MQSYYKCYLVFCNNKSEFNNDCFRVRDFPECEQAPHQKRNKTSVSFFLARHTAVLLQYSQPRHSTTKRAVRRLKMKGLVAVFLLLSVAEGTFFGRHWPPPSHPHFHPGRHFGQQVCPPGHVQTCSPPAQSQFPPAGPPPFSPPGFGPGNHATPNWNQQTQFQQNGNPNSADVSKAEWVCQNPGTGDTMIILVANGSPSQTGQNPYEETNINGNNHHGNPNDGNLNNDEHDHNVNTSPQSNPDESSQEHHGEGLIDVRIGTLN